MLVYWIPNTPDTIPANASHRISIGAFVVNANMEVILLYFFINQIEGVFGVSHQNMFGVSCQSWCFIGSK